VQAKMLKRIQIAVKKVGKANIPLVDIVNFSSQQVLKKDRVLKNYPLYYAKVF
jgi:hypothetical protein